MRVGDPSGRTGADHRAHWIGVEYVALGIFEAGSDDGTGLDAALVYASESARAVGVHSALGFAVKETAFAVRERIASRVALRTAAGWHVVDDKALRVVGARRLVDARIDAARISTGQAG